MDLQNITHKNAPPLAEKEINTQIVIHPSEVLEQEKWAEQQKMTIEKINKDLEVLLMMISFKGNVKTPQKKGRVLDIHS